MPSLDELARTLRTYATAVEFGGRTLLGADSNPVPDDWRHVTKVDPEARKRLPLLYPLYLSHTSAVSVGGSSDVTDENSEETFRLLEWAPVPAVHEPSDATHVTEYTRDQARFLAIPEVLNGDSESLVGTLGAGIEHVEETLAPSIIDDELPGWVPGPLRDRLAEFATYWLLERAVFEAYIIQNPDSAAAREANVTEADLLDPERGRQHALAAERHLGSEVLYLEYSGTYGGDEGAAILESVGDAVSWSRIWYGGGIASREDAERMLAAGADAVVVGDAFHDVAEEEVDVCARAREDLPLDADSEAVRAWVDDEVAVADSAAAQYLSTIPSVGEPVERAREYVSATVHAFLRILAIAEELDGPASPSAVRRAASDADGLPGSTSLEPAIGGDAEPFAAQVAADVVGDDPDLPVDHLGVAEAVTGGND